MRGLGCGDPGDSSPTHVPHRAAKCMEDHEKAPTPVPATTWLNLECNEWWVQEARPKRGSMRFGASRVQTWAKSTPGVSSTSEQVDTGGGSRGLLGCWLCDVHALQNPIQQCTDCFCLFYTNSEVSETRSVMSNSLQPHGQSTEFSRPEYWSG